MLSFFMIIHQIDVKIFIILLFPIISQSNFLMIGYHIKADISSGHNVVIIVTNPTKRTMPSTCLEADDVDGASDGAAMVEDEVLL